MGLPVVMDMFISIHLLTSVIFAIGLERKAVFVLQKQTAILNGVTSEVSNILQIHLYSKKYEVPYAYGETLQEILAKTFTDNQLDCVKAFDEKRHWVNGEAKISHTTLKRIYLREPELIDNYIHLKDLYFFSGKEKVNMWDDYCMRNGLEKGFKPSE